MQTTRVYTYVCWYYGLTYKRALHWISTCNRPWLPKDFRRTGATHFTKILANAAPFEERRDGSWTVKSASVPEHALANKSPTEDDSCFTLEQTAHECLRQCNNYWTFISIKFSECCT